jgi:hypothetical protein
MAHIIQLVPQTREHAGCPARFPEPRSSGVGGVYVLFTRVDDTLRAVAAARRLANAMKSGLTLVHIRSVGFAAPLEEPGGLSPVETDAFRAQLEAQDCDVRVRVCLCRDAFGALRAWLREPSVVVIGGRRRWWPTRTERWRRALEAEGHFVVSVDEAAHD